MLLLAGNGLEAVRDINFHGSFREKVATMVCMKKCFFIFALVVLTVIPAVSPALPLHGIQSWADIPAASKSDSGKANVIVNYTVQNIAQLNAASRQFKVITSDEGRNAVDRSQAVVADNALSAAVGAAGDAVLKGIDSAHYTVRQRYSFLPAMALEVDADGLSSLMADPNVVSIEANMPIPLPETGLSNAVAAPESVDPVAVFTSLIGADSPWSKGYTGQGWWVAILDTGIRSSHVFFTGKVIREACYSYVYDCPNGLSSMFGTGAAAHYPSIYAGWDHGTHVSGIAAGRDMTTAAGVAKQANIIAVNVFSKINDGTLWVGSYSSDQLAGLNYIYSLRTTYSIGAVNMSLGGGSYSAYCDSDSLKSAIDNLAAVNIAVAIASGNNGYTSSISGPACISTAVSVGASSSGDVEAGFSNYQPTMLDVFAPGVSVYSSVADSDTSFDSWDGTSMATPHVTGAWTLLRQKYPTKTVPQLLSALQAAGHAVTLKAGDQSGGNVRRIDLSTLFQSATLTGIDMLLLEN